MKIFLRNRLAAMFRSLPAFRGKGTIGELLQRALTNHTTEKECIATFQMKDGSRMRVDLRSSTEKGAFWTGSYDAGPITKLSNCLRPGSIVLDVGANIGFWSIPLGRRLAALDGTLYAVEPVPANYARLVENISLNGLERVVKPLNVALGDKEGLVQLATTPADSAAITGNAVVIGGRVFASATSAARMRRLDDLVIELGITACDFIKVDVEGGEYAFLRGGQSFIAKTRPLIYLELNYCWMEQFGWSFHDLQQFASSLGYSAYREIKGRFVPADQTGVGIENALLVPLSTQLGQTARRNLSLP